MKPSSFYLSQALHKLTESGTSEAQEAVKRALPWHKFILEPAQFGDCFAPADYADDLLAHELFRLPFDNMIIWMGPFSVQQLSGPKWQGPEWEGHEDAAQAEIAIVSKSESTLTGRFFEIAIHESSLAIRAGSGTYTYPLSMSRQEWISSDGFYELDELEKTESFVEDGLFMLGGEHPQPAEACIKIERSRFALTVFELVGILSSEGIVSEDHRAPKFINKKREMNGQAPLLSYHLLKVDHSKVKMPGVVGVGGSHASPRLHWRRGHVRKLSSGKLTIVKPCLVGDISRGGLVKDYKIH